MKFLWKQKPGIGCIAALPPAASQLPRKYLFFMMTRATEKQHGDPEVLTLSLTIPRVFLVMRGVKELEFPVHDLNRG